MTSNEQTLIIVKLKKVFWAAALCGRFFDIKTGANIGRQIFFNSLTFFTDGNNFSGIRRRLKLILSPKQGFFRF